MTIFTQEQTTQANKEIKSYPFCGGKPKYLSGSAENISLGVLNASTKLTTSILTLES